MGALASVGPRARGGNEKGETTGRRAGGGGLRHGVRGDRPDVGEEQGAAGRQATQLDLRALLGQSPEPQQGKAVSDSRRGKSRQERSGVRPVGHRLPEKAEGDVASDEECCDGGEHRTRGLLGPPSRLRRDAAIRARSKRFCHSSLVPGPDAPHQWQLAQARTLPGALHRRAPTHATHRGRRGASHGCPFCAGRWLPGPWT